jgi:hypothetical protein
MQKQLIYLILFNKILVLIAKEYKTSFTENNGCKQVIKDHEMNICFKDIKINQYFLFVCAVVFKVF